MAGHPVTLKHEQLMRGPVQLILHPANHKKVTAAHRRGRGVRLHLSGDELRNSAEHGAGFMDFLRSIKSGFDSVVNSDIYQKFAKPVVRGLVDTAVNTFVPAPYQDYAHRAASIAGDATHAFGLHSSSGYRRTGRSSRGGAVHAPVRMPKRAMSNSFNPVVQPYSPGFAPRLGFQLPAPGDAIGMSEGFGMHYAPKRSRRARGGSFRATGY